MRIGQASLRVDDEMDDYRPFYIVVVCGGGVLQIGHDPGAESYQAAAHEVGGLAVACRKDRLFRADGVAERDRQRYGDCDGFASLSPRQPAGRPVQGGDRLRCESCVVVCRCFDAVEAAVGFDGEAYRYLAVQAVLEAVRRVCYIFGKPLLQCGLSVRCEQGRFIVIPLCLQTSCISIGYDGSAVPYLLGEARYAGVQESETGNPCCYFRRRHVCYLIRVNLKQM